MPYLVLATLVAHAAGLLVLTAAYCNIQTATLFYLNDTCETYTVAMCNLHPEYGS